MNVMKRISLLILVFCLLGGLKAQESSDFYFSEAQPQELDEITKIIGEIVGEYTREEDKNVKIIVAQDSVYVQYPVIMHMSVAEITESEKYEIKDGKLFGIHESKGLPMMVTNDTAIFMHYAHELIFAPNISGVMKRHNGVYYFNYLEKNGFYTTMALSLRGDYMYLHSLDHSLVMAMIKGFSSLEEKQLEGTLTYLAAPSKDEMVSFYEDKGFKDKIKYIRKND
jgi:hypothetical protein